MSCPRLQLTFLPSSYSGSLWIWPDCGIDIDASQGLCVDLSASQSPTVNLQVSGKEPFLSCCAFFLPRESLD